MSLVTMFMPWRSRCAASILALTVSGTDWIGAQAQAPVTIVRRRCDGWLAQVQEDGGRFPAAWTPLLQKPPSSVGDLRATALACLVYIADGSTCKPSYWSSQIRSAVAWLFAHRVRFDLAEQPEVPRILDRVIATYALCEVARVSDLDSMRARLSPLLMDLLAYVRRVSTIDAELLLWVRMCARSAVSSEAAFRHRCPDASRWDFRPDLLAGLVERLRATPPVNNRQRSAAALDTLLRDDSLSAENEMYVRSSSQGTASDPWCTFYTSAALWRLAKPPKGSRLAALDPAEWRTQRELFHKHVIDAQVQRTCSRAGAESGSWAPVSLSGHANMGRVEVTALNYLSMTFRYNYCQLEIGPLRAGTTR